MITNTIIKIIDFIPAMLERFRTYMLRKKMHLNNTIQLCSNVSISHYKNVFIDNYVYLGQGLKISSQGRVKIGKGTIFGPNVTIYSANHKFRGADAIPFDECIEKKEVEIGENCWIGGNVIIVPGAKIGEGCILGAGSVVSGIIEKYSIVVGNPCKVIGYRDENEYLKLKREDKILLKIRQEKNNVKFKQ